MKLYFLCTGNSCRSQMAEGFAKAYYPTVTVASAGTHPTAVNPLAQAVMAEIGIDLSTQYAKSIDPVYFAQADVIVTLCGDARDHCPVIPISARHLHWDLVDPAQATGSRAEQLTVFRQVRDQIKARAAELKTVVPIEA